MYKEVLSKFGECLGRVSGEHAHTIRLFFVIVVSIATNQYARTYSSGLPLNKTCTYWTCSINSSLIPDWPRKFIEVKTFQTQIHIVIVFCIAVQEVLLFHWVKGFIVLWDGKSWAAMRVLSKASTCSAWHMAVHCVVLLTAHSLLPGCSARCMHVGLVCNMVQSCSQQCFLCCYIGILVTFTRLNVQLILLLKVYSLIFTEKIFVILVKQCFLPPQRFMLLTFTHLPTVSTATP